tara:strand:- start:197 stop:1126 length:930 start_codon:yes stop_codon:yes gene_type:complete
MSKIIIDEIEAKTTDIALTPNGTGNVEVTSELVDGTLQLNTSTQLNNVKIKSPPDSAGQSHTLILPDNNVEADKYLKVKSVTGSGSTAEGQLEYTTVAPIDTNNLNANDFTTGNVSNARIPSPLPNTSGFSQQLITKYTLTSDVSQIYFSGFVQGCQYTMVAKNLSTTSTDMIEMAWFDSSGSLLNGSNATGEKHQEKPTRNLWYYAAGGTGGGSSAFFGGNNTAYWRLYGAGTKSHGFIADFSTDNFSPSMNYRQWSGYYNSEGMCEAWLSIDHTPYNNIWIGGIQLKTHYGNNFTTPTEILLYKYVE